jgi:glycerol-3-phosphate dehydrogenase
MMSKPHVIIIGAGFTGVATAHDLALRGFDVTVVERGPIANGTSGRTHGLLHSGARYAVKDQESAIECIDENLILRKIVPQVIEPNGGLFIALDESDLAYGESFIEGCNACHIPITFDPLRLALSFAATAKKNGAHFHLFTEVTGFVLDGQGNVTGIKIWDRKNDTRGEMHADIVVNATGAWAGELAALAGDEGLPIHPTPGVMVTYDQRLTERAINRLNKPGDGDIILPQRQLMVVGTTSFEVEDLDYVPVIEDQIQLMLERGAELVPGIRNSNQRGAYMATRPLVGAGSTGRSIARTFKCFDHKETHNIDGLVTITGGKATTLRQMAEKTADVVCQKMGITTPCSTKDVPLISYRKFYALPN